MSSEHGYRAERGPMISQEQQTFRFCFAQFCGSLNRKDRFSLAGMYGFIVLLHVISYGVLFGLVVPKEYSLGGDHPIYNIGVGVLAYTLGLRHAFDADHIAAIDNTTRKLLSDNFETGKSAKPLSVGFWFSLGHSTIVFTLALLLAVGVKALAAPVKDDKSKLHAVTGIIGASVSGTFLWVIGVLNLVVLIHIIKIFRRMQRGDYDEQELEERLHHHGFMNRFLGGLTKSVRRPWHIYPIGVLFGLGFDTATEIGLLVLAGGAAAFNLPFYAILVLPILFAAGMCLLDTTDGVLMNAAYGWAFLKPVRKVFYNMTITAVSVAVALIIGTIELVGVLAEEAHISSGPIAAIANIPLDYAGYAIVGLFLVAWIIALLVWHCCRIEEKWSAQNQARSPLEIDAASGEPELEHHAHDLEARSADWGGTSSTAIAAAGSGYGKAHPTGSSPQPSSKTDGVASSQL